ncbi:MAG: hypothetical protein WC956_07520, partial [bacterium]
MGWPGIVDDIFAVRPWLLPFLAALYLVPILRIATTPFEYGGHIFMRINRIFGKWEHIARLPRDFIAAPLLSAFAIWNIIRAFEQGDLQRGGISLIAAALVALCFSQRSFCREGHLKLLEFVRRNPAMHPQEFFDHLFCTSGAIRHKLPELAFRTVDHKDLDFSSGGGSSWSWWRMLALGAWSTAWIARLLIRGSKYFGGPALREIASALALIWAGRVAQLSRSHVVVDGCERLEKDAGLDIFLFTHASYLDFAFATLALAARPQSGEGPTPGRCLPTFLLAKDHFKDNPVYYRLLGIGRAAEALGMIFVERGDKAGRDRARLV